MKITKAQALAILDEDEESIGKAIHEEYESGPEDLGMESRSSPC